MPICHTLARPHLPEEEPLRQQLEDEMRSPHDEGEPLVVIEQPQPSTTHLYVIWSAFAGVEQVVRSRIILNAYEAAHGQPAALDVTVSMGLTPEEAKRSGIGSPPAEPLEARIVRLQADVARLTRERDALVRRCRRWARATVSRGARLAIARPP